MRIKVIAIVSCLLVPLLADAQQARHYRWVDEDGIVHYGDKIPAQYAELPKQIVNDYGVPLEQLAGKKTEEEREADRVAAKIKMQKELQKRADRTLIVTYQNVDEIEMHRDRRVELFQAQSRVTELYLRNQRRALDLMEREAIGFKPYSSDPSAAMVDPELVASINDTKETITRHETNLLRYQSEEKQIIARFAGDIDRFKVLKGID